MTRHNFTIFTGKISTFWTHQQKQYILANSSAVLSIFIECKNHKDEGFIFECKRLKTYLRIRESKLQIIPFNESTSFIQNCLN
jgi:hypothetical protein